MSRAIMAALVLVAASPYFDANAQSPQRPTDKILSFEVQGISTRMAPERARDVLLQAGFTEKGGGDRSR